MKILKTVFIGMVALCLATAPAYAEPGKGKGKAKGQDKQNQKGNQSSNANAQAAEKRTHRTERGRRDADVRANRPDNGRNDNRVVRANRTARTERGRSADHFGKKEAKDKADKFFNALKHARWSYNPKDERGQGNMGKSRMRDPYGFDKDSDREKSDRGRPIHEALLNLADILNIDFTIIDVYLAYLQEALARYQTYAERYPQYADLYAGYATYFQNIINNYISRYPTSDRIRTNYTDSIDYTLTFNSDRFEGTNLLVTTSLINTNTYDGYSWHYDPITRTWEGYDVHYDADEVVIEQTQEVVLGEDNTVSFSYDPPTELAGYSGFYADLAVTVTEPESGQTYTMTYDRQLYVHRCPYGKVYNAKTREPVVGARVCVHFEDGSIVPLDKASNPTAKNPQTTDATGRYGVKLRTNRKYYLTAKADGYADYKSEVFTEKWHVLREDIALTPLEQVVQK